MHTHHRQEDAEIVDEPEEQTKVGEKSYIQVGFVVVLCGFLVGAIWWASAMQSKMDQVIEEVKSSRVLQTKVNEDSTELQLLKLRVLQLEQKK